MARGAKKGIQIETIGAVEIQKLFKSIPNDLALKVLQDINRVPANIYKKEMQNRAPVGSDKIHDNIKVERDKTDKTGLLIGPTIKAFWARFYEKGTKVRTTKGKGPVHFKSGGRGKMSPKPFIAPAIESATKPAIKSAFDKMGKRVLAFLKRKTKAMNNRTKSRAK